MVCEMGGVGEGGVEVGSVKERASATVPTLSQDAVNMDEGAELTTSHTHLLCHAHLGLVASFQHSRR